MAQIAFRQVAPKRRERAVGRARHEAGAKDPRTEADRRRYPDQALGVGLPRKLLFRIAVKPAWEVSFAKMQWILFGQRKLPARLDARDDDLGGHQRQPVGLAARDRAHDEIPLPGFIENGLILPGQPQRVAGRNRDQEIVIHDAYARTDFGRPKAEGAAHSAEPDQPPTAAGCAGPGSPG
jgi:hypothetical protein